MTNYSPGLTRITATVGGVQRYFSRDVQIGLNNPSLFIFFSGNATKLSKLFGVFLKKYNLIGIYVEAIIPLSGKSNFDVTSPITTNKDLAFFKYILEQYPNMTVFVAGSSTGAEMAIYLGAQGFCDSIVTFAGSVWKGLNITHKPHVFAVHGTEDTSVPFNGSSPGRVNHGLDLFSAYISIEKFSALPIKRTVSSWTLGGQMNVYTSTNQPNKAQLLAVSNIGHSVMSYKGTNGGIGLIESVFIWLSNLPVVK